jgi:hypothetical protein
MPSPFPGMDPYLEEPNLGRDVHHGFISTAQALLAAQLRPNYIVRIGERVYIDDEVMVISGRQLQPSEEELREAFLNVIDVESRDVITVIEFLSPANKILGANARAGFERHRDEVLSSPSHLVVIDLLRGSRMLPVPTDLVHEYAVHVSRRGLRPQGALYPLRLSERLPIIPIPLKVGDPDARLDLQALPDQNYDRACYDLEIDYRAEPEPPLDPEMAAWADEMLRSKGLR